MKPLLIAAALATILLAGCAGQRTTAADVDPALQDCRAEADRQCKARYTDTWEAIVKDCMQRRSGATD